MPTAKATRSRVDRRTRTARDQARDAREVLLEAALDVLAKRGFRDASVDEIAARAGYSKGAVYWHFSSKDDLFFALLDERIDKPWRETIEQLKNAPPDQDMAPAASRRFAEMLQNQRELLLLEQEYWAQAARQPKIRQRYAKRQQQLRQAFAKALQARLDHLGAPPLTGTQAENIATAFIGLAAGLARQKLIEPDAVPDNLLGDTFALVYAGHVARATPTTAGDPR